MVGDGVCVVLFFIAVRLESCKYHKFVAKLTGIQLGTNRVQ